MQLRIADQLHRHHRPRRDSRQGDGDVMRASSHWKTVASRATWLGATRMRFNLGILPRGGEGIERAYERHWRSPRRRSASSRFGVAFPRGAPMRRHPARGRQGRSTTAFFPETQPSADRREPQEGRGYLEVEVVFVSEAEASTVRGHDERAARGHGWFSLTSCRPRWRYGSPTRLDAVAERLRADSFSEEDLQLSAADHKPAQPGYSGYVIWALRRMTVLFPLCPLISNAIRISGCEAQGDRGSGNETTTWPLVCS